MKAMISGLAFMIVVSVGAYFALQELGFSSQAVNSSQNVRLE